MTHLSDAIGRPLKWVQPAAFAWKYELRSDEDVLGSLTFRSAFGSLATAQSGDGCWTFKRVGFFQTRATIRACGDENNLGIFNHQTWSGGGTLEMASGLRLLVDTSLWRSSLEFKTESGETLMRLVLSGVFHQGATVEISPNARPMTELPLLVMLGWYLLVMIQSDQAASTVIVS